MFAINDKEIKEFEKDLKAFAHRAYPFATKNTLNKSAFHAQGLARKGVDTKMTLRNKFTKQSIQVDQARTLNVSRQSSRVGSTADYMEDQEFGATQSRSGKKGIPIATGYSAGQEGQTPRTRLPRKANKMVNIRLRRRNARRAKTRKQEVLFRIQDAVASGNRTIYLNLGKRQGIFRVVGGSKRFKRGGPKGARIKMLHDMTNSSLVTPRNPWLRPVIDPTQKVMPEFYRDALVFQLRRQGLFKGS